MIALINHTPLVETITDNHDGLRCACCDQPLKVIQQRYSISVECQTLTCKLRFKPMTPSLHDRAALKVRS
jgi:hypothetical protein